MLYKLNVTELFILFLFLINYNNMLSFLYQAEKDWRFGWWDGEKQNIQVEKMEEPIEEEEDDEDEVKKQLKLKKKFIEERAKLLEEKRKQIIGDKNVDKEISEDKNVTQHITNGNISNENENKNDVKEIKNKTETSQKE